VHQHGAGDSGGFIERKTAERNAPKGGQKERTHRDGHDGSAGRVKNFRAPAMLKTAPLDCGRKAT